MSGNKGKGKCVAWVFNNVAHCGEDCLIWPYNRLKDGYGQFGFMGRLVRAHVMMCELANGRPPTLEHEAAHTCGNGHLGCVNPKHLEWKTRADNQNDRYRNGQRISKRGKPRVKLTLEQAQEIRNLKGQVTQQSLADRFGVSRTNIIMIQNGETWSGKKRVPNILTVEQVLQIRASTDSRSSLAEKFGRTEESIRRIQARKFYQYLPNASCTSAYQTTKEG